MLIRRDYLQRIVCSIITLSADDCAYLPIHSMHRATAGSFQVNEEKAGLVENNAEDFHIPPTTSNPAQRNDNNNIDRSI